MNRRQIMYLIISPVRDEDRNIEKTLQSVIRQTHKPLKWIIVDDGSTDGTVDIVENYCQDYDWITLLRLPMNW